jgi:hypothetical protein
VISTSHFLTKGVRLLEEIADSKFEEGNVQNIWEYLVMPETRRLSKTQDHVRNSQEPN